MRRSLLAAVSHDLRTPLATIKTTVTDLLAEDSPHDGAYVREALAEHPRRRAVGSRP